MRVPIKHKRLQTARWTCRFLSQLDLPELPSNGIKVAYHAACSLQHGQQVKEAPKRSCVGLGFDVEPRVYLLWVSRTYNLLQPEIAGRA